MNREKKLIQNTVIIAIGKISTQCVTFLLLPVYTAMLSTEDYGLVDLLNVCITLMVPFISLQLSVALFRFLLDAKNEKERSEIVSNVFTVVLINIVLFVLGFSVVTQFFTVQYEYYLALGLIANILAEITLQYARGMGNMIMYSLTSFIIASINIGCNIVMIVVLHMGGISILIATIISNLIGALFVTFRLKIYRNVQFSLVNRNMVKELVQYSYPLVPNAISWWITNTSDRLLISGIIGTGANGIYAIANKIPNVYIVIFNIYNLAWTESLSRSIHDSDAEEYINKIYHSSFRLLSGFVVGLIVCISLCFDIIIGANFKEAYHLILILIIAMFINSLCSMYGGIFTAYKKTGSIGKTTVYGAIINIIINVALIQWIGLYAAAISTVFAYIVILYKRKKEADQLVRITYSWRYLCSLAVMLTIVSAGYLSHQTVVNLILLVVVTIWFVCINKEILQNGFTMVKKKLGQRSEIV